MVLMEEGLSDLSKMSLSSRREQQSFTRLIYRCIQVGTLWNFKWGSRTAN